MGAQLRPGPGPHGCVAFVGVSMDTSRESVLQLLAVRVHVEEGVVDQDPLQQRSQRVQSDCQ
eukprot:6463243-Amphidinium_carterae.1